MQQVRPQNNDNSDLLAVILHLVTCFAVAFLLILQLGEDGAHEGGNVRHIEVLLAVVIAVFSLANIEDNHRFLRNNASVFGVLREVVEHDFFRILVRVSLHGDTSVEGNTIGVGNLPFFFFAFFFVKFTHTSVTALVNGDGIS